MNFENGANYHQMVVEYYPYQAIAIELVHDRRARSVELSGERSLRRNYPSDPHPGRFPPAGQWGGKYCDNQQRPQDFDYIDLRRRRGGCITSVLDSVHFCKREGAHVRVWHFRFILYVGRSNKSVASSNISAVHGE
jgi:hypothetical protein